MNAHLALSIITQFPAIRSSSRSPAYLVNAHWPTLFGEKPLPSHEVKVWHNQYATETDWWEAANQMEQAAMTYLVVRLDATA